MLKKTAIVISYIVGVVIVLFIALFAPIDHSPLNEFPAVIQTYNNLNAVKLDTSKGNDKLRAGWSAINITPKTPIDMAGYGMRGPYTSVTDSLFARTMVIDNGNKRMAIISLDLLMFPPEIMSIIYDTLSQYGYSRDELYFSATHTHNGFGNWEKSIAGGLIFGAYSMDNSQHLANKIVESVLDAQSKMSFAVIAFQKVEAKDWVTNRISGSGGVVDPYLRVIQVKKENGNMGLLVSYAAHAVNLDADIWQISRDYPGELVDRLEKSPDIDFAMFCAGMVASHNLKSNLPKGRMRIKKAGEQLAEKILAVKDSADYSANATIGTYDFEVLLPPSQMRISCGFHVRDWVFKTLLGSLQANIKIMEIGDVLLLGMPCDFSGELSIKNQLDQLAAANGKDLFITSFNGNYIGYITNDGHYNACNHDEVKTMNWVGPNKGAYFTRIIQSIIEMPHD